MKHSLYQLHQTVYIISDSMGWYHGIKDGRPVKVMVIHPLHSINTFEYTVQDNNGDFWHIPEGDLSSTAPLTPTK